MNRHWNQRRHSAGGEDTIQGKIVIPPSRDLPILQIRLPVNPIDFSQKVGKSPDLSVKKRRIDTRQVNILLDSGSNTTMVSEQCAQDLNLFKFSEDNNITIGTVHGVCVSKSNNVLIDFNPPRRGGHKLPTFTMSAYTHKGLGLIPNSSYPIIPSFRDHSTAIAQYNDLNGIYPRIDEELDILVSQSDLTRFLWVGMEVFSNLHPNKYSITNFSKGGEGYVRWDTHWGAIWAGGGPRPCKGAAHPHALKHRPNGESKKPNPITVENASKTEIPHAESQENFQNDINTYYTTEDLVIAFRRMVELDRLPMRKEDKPYTEEELMAIKKIEDVMFLQPDIRRMHTRLLLKESLNLKNNYFIVLGRMESLYRSFRMHPVKNARKKEEFIKNWEMFQEYQVVKKYDDPVPWEDDTGKKNYLAMTVVVKLTSLTTPYRTCVCGDTQTSTGLSLNDNILTTPSLHQKIADIEARSRLGKYLLIADIKKLFLHMYIDNEDDRRLLRVLYKDPDGDPNAPWEVWAFTASIYGLKDSPFQLNAAIAKCTNYWKEMTERSDFELSVASKFIRATYVDDLTLCFNDLNQAIEAVKICSDIVAQGGFKFRKWISNDTRILETIPEDERAPHSIIIEQQRDQEMEKYVSDPTLQLGYRYSAEKDSYIMDRFGAIASSRDTQSKKGVASCLASVFDPLKLIGPFILTAKRVMKECHRYKLDWKDSIQTLLEHPDVINEGQQEHIANILALWANWLAQLSELERVTFPRYIINNKDSLYIIASDASSIGLCACVHIVTTECGVTTSHLLSSLCNITPLKTKMEKTLTIPLLELKAIGLACDLGIWLIDELDIDPSKLVFVSDSRTAISWTLKRVESLILTVANVVKRVQSRGFTIKFVPGEDNGAADLGSRGATVSDINGSVWKHGPDWYRKPVEEHPYLSVESTEDKYNLADLGLKKKYSVLEPQRGVNIDEKTAEIRSIFMDSAKTMFSVHFGVTSTFAEKVCEYKHRPCKKRKLKLGPLQRHVAKKLPKLAIGTAAAVGSVNATTAESTIPLSAYRGIKCIIPALSYHSATDWGYKKVIKAAALVFCAVDKFKMWGCLDDRTRSHAELFSPQQIKDAKLGQKDEERTKIIQQHVKTHYPELSDEYKVQAQTYFLVLSQWKHFEEEMIDLHKPPVGGKPSQVKVKSSLAKYSPQLRSAGIGRLKIMHITSRHDTQNLPLETKDPPILSKKARFAVLFIRYIHVHVFTHSSALQTYNHLKRSVFIPAGLQLCKKILRLCVLCKKMSSKRLDQMMGQLPQPFQHSPEGYIPKRFEFTAVDYTGAIVISPMGHRNTHSFKCYLCIFYCLYSKAYFVTPVPTNGTDTFLIAFEKLATTFGRPVHLFSDQQPSFVKGSTILRQRISFLNNHIKSLHANEKFEWSFGIAHSPQSLWEKPIYEAKRCLYKIFKQPDLSMAKPVLNFNQLDLICRRIGFNLNERPLMSDKLTSPDSLSFITPHRLIYGGDLSAVMLNLSETTIPLNSEIQRSMLKKVDAFVRQFNNIYQKHYVIEARARNYWNRRKPNIQIDDLLLIESHGTRKYEKRASWSAGVVVSVIRGRDDCIRRVELREADGRVRVHPVHDLFPLIDEFTRNSAREVDATN